MLTHARSPSCNISKEEKLALNNLKRNKKLIILNEDKGNATVIMDRFEYDKKMEEHLNNSGCYKILNKYPNTKILK